MKNLSELLIGEVGEVCRIDDKCNIKRRLNDLGVIEGTRIKCIFESFKQSPRAYLIKDSIIAIRADDSNSVILW